MRNTCCPWCKTTTTLGDLSRPPIVQPCKSCVDLLRKGPLPPSTGWIYPGITGAMQ